MNMKLRTILTLPCLAAVLGLAGAAHASTVTGTVFSTLPFPAPLNPSQTPGSIPGTTTFGTFSLSGINTLNLFSGGGPSYTVAGFLTSGGGTAAFSNGTVGGLILNNKELQIMGTTFLQAGVTYTVRHDDGVYLYLGGNPIPVIASPGPNAALSNTFTVATTGGYSFDLLYAEVNNAPATLNFNGPLATPEPSSFILLGSGLLAAAGAVRRRLTV